MTRYLLMKYKLYIRGGSCPASDFIYCRNVKDGNGWVSANAPVGGGVADSGHQGEGVLGPGVQVEGSHPRDVGTQVPVDTCHNREGSF
jgi:hypothetical protein